MSKLIKNSLLIILSLLIVVFFIWYLFIPKINESKAIEIATKKWHGVESVLSVNKYQSSVEKTGPYFLKKLSPVYSINFLVVDEYTTGRSEVVVHVQIDGINGKLINSFAKVNND